ncbi:MAG: tRNA (adenosine(37)-N6)-threonylcarbamoyltransferase complex dimerization subunit type 1 TsaB [Myxococcales bacterium]|nr:tRNA (adenosine(37)-N6)-threonylcarbamoyltransferase complex dimerization subunit type 1 TsaB [Myxococcales bacterium]
MSGKDEATPEAIWLLALDASTPRCVIALGRVDAHGPGLPELVVEDDEDDGANQASSRLLPRVERALASASIDAGHLAAIACGRGPGTFTGTRVAVASAKGLAYGVGRPVVPVSTLAAVAASAGIEGDVLAILDARRDEVYGARLWCEGLTGPGPARIEARGDERVTPLAVLLEDLPATTRVVGSGVEPYRDLLASAGRADAAVALVGPTAAGLWAAATAAWARGEAVHPAALDAVYLRASYAEMGINAPKRRFVKSPFV